MAARPSAMMAWRRAGSRGLRTRAGIGAAEDGAEELAAEVDLLLLGGESGAEVFELLLGGELVGGGLGGAVAHFGGRVLGVAATVVAGVDFLAGEVEVEDADVAAFAHGKGSGLAGGGLGSG
jgi:hypothetical protein